MTHLTLALTIVAAAFFHWQTPHTYNEVIDGKKEKDCSQSGGSIKKSLCTKPTRVVEQYLHYDSISIGFLQSN